MYCFFELKILSTNYNHHDNHFTLVIITYVISFIIGYVLSIRLYLQKSYLDFVLGYIHTIFYLFLVKIILFDCKFDLLNVLTVLIVYGIGACYLCYIMLTGIKGLFGNKQSY